MFDITSPADDPRYQQVAAKLGELQEAAAKLRERFEAARKAGAHSPKDDAVRLLAGTLTVAEKEAAEAVWQQIETHEAAIQLLKDQLGQLNADLSRDICRKVKATHDAKVA